MRVINFFGTAIVCALLFFGCQGSGDSANESTVSGKVISNSECKKHAATNSQSLIEDDHRISSIEYSYNPSTKILSISHINAGFNCCPGKLSCNAKLTGSTITITESEEKSLYDCLCLYDLNIEIAGVELQKYSIVTIEPYVGNLPKLNFDIDLTKTTFGTYKVVRDSYPWM